MSNKKHSVLSVTLILIFSLIINTIPAFADSNTPVFKFTAMSDIHIDDVLIQGSRKNRDQFKAALKSSYEKGYSDLFLCGGDVSSYGNTSEWDNTKSYINSAGYENIVWALGNHAYGTLGTNTNAANDFKKFASLDNVYHHDVINGYDFICYGCERTDLLIGDLVYSEAQENWILNEIEQTAKSSEGKPIFVVSHYPISRTRIADKLAEYNNIIFFYGHVHDDDWENYTIDRYIDTSNNYTLARVGSVQYGYTNAADAMLVDVYYDKVVLTVDRTDGKVLSDNSKTISLTLPPWKALSGAGSLYWYLPNKSDIILCISCFDANGKMLDLNMIQIMPDMDEYPIPSGIADDIAFFKTFFVNHQFVPYGEATRYEK